MRLSSARFLGLGLAGALGWVSACGTGATKASSSSTSGDGSSDVTGTMIYRYHGEGAPVDQPADLSGAEVVAFVWESGAWTSYPGTGTAAGTFTVPNVPAGPFLIAVGGNHHYAYTTARALDLGADLAGRPNAVFGPSTNTIDGELTNLDPWQADDLIQWYAPNVDGWAPSSLSSAPSTGATTFSGPSSWWQGRLIDASQGDMLYATQVSERIVMGNEVQVLSRYASFTGVEQQDGTPVTVSGALGAVAATESISLDFRGSQFEALLAAVSPSASAIATAATVYTQPGAGVAVAYSPGPDLLSLFTGNEDVKVTIPYPNPFPAAWGEILYTGTMWQVPFTAPGATSSGPLLGYTYSTMPAGEASTKVLVPLVSPPRSPEIGGKSASGDLEGIGLTPTLSWSAPAVGTPTAYQVTVWEVEIDDAYDGGSVIGQQAMIVTTTTNLTLPPGLLQKGHAYALTITAVASPIDATTTPFRSSPSMAVADVVTGLVTP